MHGIWTEIRTAPCFIGIRWFARHFVDDSLITQTYTVETESVRDRERVFQNRPTTIVIQQSRFRVWLNWVYMLIYPQFFFLTGNCHRYNFCITIYNKHNNISRVHRKLLHQIRLDFCVGLESRILHFAGWKPFASSKCCFCIERFSLKYRKFA